MCARERDAAGVQLGGAERRSVSELNVSTLLEDFVQVPSMPSLSAFGWDLNTDRDHAPPDTCRKAGSMSSFDSSLSFSSLRSVLV